jgi:hypothetical protein
MRSAASPNTIHINLIYGYNFCLSIANVKVINPHRFIGEEVIKIIKNLRVQAEITTYNN